MHTQCNWFGCRQVAMPLFGRLRIKRHSWVKLWGLWSEIIDQTGYCKIVVELYRKGSAIGDSFYMLVSDSVIKNWYTYICRNISFVLDFKYRKFKPERLGIWPFATITDWLRAQKADLQFLQHHRNNSTFFKKREKKITTSICWICSMELDPMPGKTKYYVCRFIWTPPNGYRKSNRILQNCFQQSSGTNLF